MNTFTSILVDNVVVKELAPRKLDPQETASVTKALLTNDHRLHYREER